jgi:RNA polymerase-binding transcription factor DksA
MPALPDADLHRLQQQMDRREAELRAEVKSVREEPDSIHGESPREQAEDFGEQGEERIRHAVRYAEEERDIEELRDIEGARERIAAGSYGGCADCGRDIPLQRLLVQPTAKRCIDCQEKFERSHPASPRFSPGL